MLTRKKIEKLIEELRDAQLQQAKAQTESTEIEKSKDAREQLEKEAKAKAEQEAKQNNLLLLRRLKKG